MFQFSTDAVPVSLETILTKKRQRQSRKKGKNRLDVGKYTKLRLGVRYSERENIEIVTFGPNKVSVSPLQGGKMLSLPRLKIPQTTEKMTMTAR